MHDNTKTSIVTFAGLAIAIGPVMLAFIGLTRSNINGLLGEINWRY